MLVKAGDCPKGSAHVNPWIPCFFRLAGPLLHSAKSSSAPPRAASNTGSRESSRSAIPSTVQSSVWLCMYSRSRIENAFHLRIQECPSVRHGVKPLGLPQVKLFCIAIRSERPTKPPEFPGPVHSAFPSTFLILALDSWGCFPSFSRATRSSWATGEQISKFSTWYLHARSPRLWFFPVVGSAGRLDPLLHMERDRDDKFSGEEGGYGFYPVFFLQIGWCVGSISSLFRLFFLFLHFVFCLAFLLVCAWVYCRSSLYYEYVMCDVVVFCTE